MDIREVEYQLFELIRENSEVFRDGQKGSWSLAYNLTVQINDTVFRFTKEKNGKRKISVVEEIEID